jgi:hypothetical protein
MEYGQGILQDQLNFNAPEKLLKMIPLKGVTANHDFERIGILLGSLLYGIMALAAG